MNKWIDLRSDTVTTPTEEMRLAMYQAEVGDDVFSDDPTVNKLEQLIAQKLGKEAAIFCPSGTFSNQLALFTHCQKGDEVILDQQAHIVQHESGASAVISGVQLFTLEGINGVWNLDKLRKAIKVKTVSTTKTKLICMETAFNGAVLPLEYMANVYQIAKEFHLAVHLDGARLFNAATSLQVDVKEIAQYADTVSVCLSKGLAAPAGTLLVGPKAFIEEARWKRKLMGGGMRQVGILAAAGIIAIDKMSQRLSIDHENAAYLASRLKEIPHLQVDESQRQINMVFFDIPDPKKHQLEQYLFSHHVKILPYEFGFRFVTHYQVNQGDIDIVIKLMKEYFNHA